MSTVQNKSKSTRGLRGAIRTVLLFAGLAMIVIGVAAVAQGIGSGWQVLAQGSVLYVVARYILC